MAYRFKSYCKSAIAICTMAFLLPNLAQAALERFIVENRTAAATLMVIVKQDGKTLWKGTAKPGEDFKYKGLVCKPVYCTYEVYVQDANSNNTLIASGGLKTVNEHTLEWYDENKNGSDRDDVANDAFKVNNNKKGSTSKMKILKVSDL